jgi:hypothetical protein
VSFILYSLYAPHPITINPFRSVLFFAYVKEREKAIRVTDEGGTSPNEQLVWVLWKILKGDGNDVSVSCLYVFWLFSYSFFFSPSPDRTLFPKHFGALASPSQT